MNEDYGKIAQQMVSLIEQVPTKRYGEVNLVLAQELGLVLADTGEQDKLKELIEDALCTDGSHHKQWYLEQIAEKLGIDISDVGHEKGIAP